MKKLLTLVLSLVCMLGLAGCQKTIKSLEVYSFPDPTTLITGIFYSQGQETAFEIGSGDNTPNDLAANSVITWFYGLELTTCDKPEAVEGAESYDFYVMGETAFTYEDRGGEAYIIINGTYYAVKNPSKPPIEKNTKNEANLSPNNSIIEETIVPDTINSIPIVDLAPGEEVTFSSEFSVSTDNACLDYSITYSRASLALIVGLRAEDGSEHSAEITGGDSDGRITGVPAGNYTVFVRSSEDNLKHKDTTTESLNITGCMNFALETKEPKN